MSSLLLLNDGIGYIAMLVSKQTVGLHRDPQKTAPLWATFIFAIYDIWFLLVDINSFFSQLQSRNDQRAYLKQNLPLHLNCVAALALPCKI